MDFGIRGKSSGDLHPPTPTPPSLPFPNPPHSLSPSILWGAHLDLGWGTKGGRGLGASRGRGEVGAGKGGDNEMKMVDEFGGWRDGMRGASPFGTRSLEAWGLIPVCCVARAAHGPHELL